MSTHPPENHQSKPQLKTHSSSGSHYVSSAVASDPVEQGGDGGAAAAGNDPMTVDGDGSADALPSPLFIACRNGFANVVGPLLAAGANPFAFYPDPSDGDPRRRFTS